MTAKEKKLQADAEISAEDELVDGAKKKRQRRQPATQRQQVEMVQFVGLRLRQARELNGLIVSEAARRFGFSNGGRLSKIENGRHITAIPLWVISEAARVYEVSTDYLLGVTDEPGERAARVLSREASTWLQALLERQRLRDMETLALVHEQIVAAISAQRGVSVAVQDLEQAISKFKELNPRFSDMKGGAAVVYHVEKTMQTCAQVSTSLNKFKQSARAARGVTALDDAQMNLLG